MAGKFFREINPNTDSLYWWNSRRLKNPDLGPVNRVLYYANFKRFRRLLALSPFYPFLLPYAPGFGYLFFYADI